MTEQRKIVCPKHPDTELHRFAPYSAPGIGWSAECPIDDEPWSVLGGEAYDPDDMVHIGGAEAFR